MSNEKKSLVFFGSGPVAAESLDLLINEFEIEAVVTKPTTKREMEAASKDVEVFCVSNRKELDELFTTKKFKSELGVLIDFGIIVSQKVIDYFPLGIINSHFSLLPELRGADPISFSILEGKKKTGVSLMLLVEAMDEGPILALGMFDLDFSETTPSLTKELIQLSHSLLVENIPKYLSGEIEPATQEVVQKKFELSESYTRKLNKNDGLITWDKSAVELDREVRAYQDWPKSRTKLGDVEVIITEAHSLPSNNPELKPGEIESLDSPLVIQTGDGQLCIEKLKPAGKKEMDAKAFLAGYKNRLS